MTKPHTAPSEPVEPPVPSHHASRQNNSTMASRAAARRARVAAGWTPPPPREFGIDVSQDFNQPSRQVVVNHVDG
jgi:hypothetical protein